MIIYLKNNNIDIRFKNCTVLYICKFFICLDYITNWRKTLSFKENNMFYKKKGLPIGMISKNYNQVSFSNFTYGFIVKIAIYS